MAVPTLTVADTTAQQVAADVVVLAVRTSDDGPHVVDAELPDLDLASIGVTGAIGDAVRLPGTGFAAASVLLVGIGRSLDVDGLRAAAGAAVRRLAGVEHVAI